MKNYGCGLFLWLLCSHFLCNGAETRTIAISEAPSLATIRIDARNRSPYKIPAYITGKFAEHLGANIYGGMDAQILRNATFADYPFCNGQMTPDGVTQFYSENDKINQELRRQAARAGWAETEIENLVRSRSDALACWWIREGAVEFSPDTGSDGGRAQRVAVREAGQGIAQWVYLPLHRVRKFEFEIYARSPDASDLAVSLISSSGKSVSTADITGLTRDWQKVIGVLKVPADFPDAAQYKFSVTAKSPGQFVLGHVFLRPADHINGADPDIIKFLKGSRLPLLRWPGGNFVCGYHWQDGVGPVVQRPTKPNYAWGGVEPNTFGTDEFMAFCKAVGCEPMICINAGSGTPAEAAAWIEYCNGAAKTPMGARRAANGHPKPYNVHHWEVGNELWGHWQYNWTTASGYVDRYTAFSETMLAADSSIQLYACGAPVFWGKQWNDILISGAATILKATTDHPLIGGNVPSSTDPLDVYRDFMAVPDVLEQKWADLQTSMLKAGVREAHLAVTELQLFAHLAGGSGDAPVRLNHSNLVNPGTLAEGLYDVLIYHACVRLAPFVSMVTHSAIVNHGGGLRKERESVYANPCYYAQAAFAEFAEATPVHVTIVTPIQKAPLVLPELKNVTTSANFTSIDALAAIAKDGSLLVSLVHRGTGPNIRLGLFLDGFKTAGTAELRVLRANVPWAANTLESPKAVVPVDSKLKVVDNALEVELEPYSFARLRIAP